MSQHYTSQVRHLQEKRKQAWEAGDAARALELGTKIVEVYRDNGATESEGFANALHNLGVLNDYAGLLGQARDCYQESAQIKKGLLGEDSLSYADTLNNLAVDQGLLGKLTQAAVLHKAVWQLRSRVLGENDPQTIASLYNRAAAAEDLRQQNQAVELLLTARSRAQDNPEVKPEDMGDIQAALGRNYEKIGNYAEAVRCLEEAIERLPAPSFCAVEAYLALSRVYERMDEPEQGAEALTKGLALRRQVLDENHLDFVNALNSLARLESKAGHFAKAREHYREALGILEKLVGQRHSLYADTLERLARACARDGDGAEARQLCVKSLALRFGTEGEQSISYGTGLLRQAKTALELGDFCKAVESGKKALKTYREAAGEPSYFVMIALRDLGRIYARMEEHELAVHYMTQSLRMRVVLLRRKGGAYARQLETLAAAYQAGGQPDKALEALEEASGLRKRRYGYQHPRYAKGLFLLAGQEFTMGRYADAADDLLVTLEIWGNMMGKQSRAYQKALALYQQVLEAVNGGENAE